MNWKTLFCACAVAGVLSGTPALCAEPTPGETATKVADATQKSTLFDIKGMT